MAAAFLHHFHITLAALISLWIDAISVFRVPGDVCPCGRTAAGTKAVSRCLPLNVPSLPLVSLPGEGCVEWLHWEPRALVTWLLLKQESRQGRNKTVQIGKSGGEAAAITELLQSCYSALRYVWSYSLQRGPRSAAAAPGALQG